MCLLQQKKKWNKETHRENKLKLRSFNDLGCSKEGLISRFPRLFQFFFPDFSRLFLIFPDFSRNLPKCPFPWLEKVLSNFQVSRPSGNPVEYFRCDSPRTWEWSWAPWPSCWSAGAAGTSASRWRWGTRGCRSAPCPRPAGTAGSRTYLQIEGRESEETGKCSSDGPQG